VLSSGAESEESRGTIVRLGRGGRERRSLEWADDSHIQRRVDDEVSGHEKVRAAAEAVFFGVLGLGLLASGNAAIVVHVRCALQNRRGEAEKLFRTHFGREDVDARERDEEEGEGPEEQTHPASRSTSV
jgi:hypothetical protein